MSPLAMSIEESKKSNYRRGNKESSTPHSKYKGISSKKPKRKKDQIPTVVPEGKTLPKSVYRFRLPFKFANGSSGYDGSGRKKESGFKASASGFAAVMEYGLSDRLSLQLVVPYVLSNQLKRNDNAFLNRDDVIALVQGSRQKLTAGIAAQLLAAGACPTLETCTKAIESGAAKAAADTPIPLPNGTTATIPAGVAFRDGIESIVTSGALASDAANPESGATGLGDIELGFQYAVLTRGSVLVSTGAGLRLPTGAFTDVSARQRNTGRGTTDLGIRVNADMPLGEIAMVSFQNQSETMISGGKKKRDSGESVTFKRIGFRQVGFLKGTVNLSAINASMRPANIFTGLSYDNDNEERYDNIASPKQESSGWFVGSSLSGLEHNIPASVDVEYKIPLTGKNVPIATTVFSTTAKIYWRF